MLVPWILAALAVAPALAGEADTCFVERSTWAGTMWATRAKCQAARQQGDAARPTVGLWLQIAAAHPVEADWMLQDLGAPEACLHWFRLKDPARIEARLVSSLRATPGVVSANERIPRGRRAFLRWYADACEKRRAARLGPLLARWPSIVFTRHYDLGGTHYAYTEGQSDAQRERTFVPGASLCVLEMEGTRGRVRTLIEDARGVIRDPDVSFDGGKILFAWKKSDREDDYHLYDFDVATGGVRQLTSGLGFADYEGAYLPNGDIMFNSTRCVQTVDCWWTEVSNFYTCDADGRFLRRLGFDQVHTNYPTVTEYGQVLYTRWDYNDRGQIYPQPLFQMNPDGTGQTEFYGNNAWFPTTILHARDIPGSPLTIGVLSGHHSRQRGKLALIDPRKGRQEAAGIQIVAPVQTTEAVRVDAYGQEGDSFQYPYPLDEEHYLVAYTPYPRTKQTPTVPFGLYFMDIDGHRELLASDAAISCNQPVPLAPRGTVHQRPNVVDYRRDEGVYYVQDVYAGPGLAGVPRGSIKYLRVIALDYRAAGVGANGNNGPAGGALVSTPIAVGNGAWDAKIVLGEAKVHEDGSAMFRVPARTPVYFQAIDENGYAAQTMRSWSTLQPGERLSCVGCHEHKSAAPLAASGTSYAMREGPEALRPFHGPARGFSFPAEIQPILDRNCVQCHNDRTWTAETGTPVKANRDGKVFSLLGETRHDPHAERHWSDGYLNLLRSFRRERDGKPEAYRAEPNAWVDWAGTQSVPSMLEPYTAGAATSGLMKLLREGHHDVVLTREELDKIACWIDLFVPYCGDYTEANAWDEDGQALYARFLTKRQKMAAAEGHNIQALLNGRGNNRDAGAVEKALANQTGI